jgi:hypothetical protein
LEFQHITLQVVKEELGNRDLLIMELQGRINALMEIPGVKEAIENHVKAQAAAKSNGTVPGAQPVEEPHVV